MVKWNTQWDACRGKFALSVTAWRLDSELQCQEQLFGSWMVAHAAETIGRYQVGRDGKMAYERIRGGWCWRRLLEPGRSELLIPQCVFVVFSCAVKTSENLRFAFSHLPHSALPYSFHIILERDV